jgi:hypothetical protein
MKKHLTLALALLTVLCTSAQAQLPSYLPADGLVGWWPFNGNANDESGNGNDGMVYGATLAADRFGNAVSAYSFDGVDDFIEVQSQTLNGVSVAGWFNIEAPGTSSSGGLSSLVSTLMGPFYTGFELRINETLFPEWLIGGNGTWQSNINSSEVSLNSWHYLVGVWNGDLGSSTIYLDGDDVSTTSASYFTNNVSSLLFGTRGNYSNGGWFQGYLDDIGIWNRALTEQEIQNLFTGTNTTTDSGDGAAPLPQGIPYQAAARDANGQPVADSPVNVRFTLHEGAADGTSSYIESHSLSTNSIGLFNTVFGNGTPEQSAFDSINWAATTKFLQVEIDLGSGYVDMGTTQLLSVPYAFRSAQAATLKNAALPIYPDNAAALAGGLVAGEMYRTATGDLKIVY